MATTTNAVNCTQLGQVMYSGASGVWSQGAKLGAYNIGFTYSGGTFTVAGSDGTALSATNPGYVVFPGATAGNLITIPVTANQTFTDGSGGTIAGMKFGLPYGGSDVSWATNMPFFCYAVAKSDRSAVAFMVSRKPNATRAPVAANIGKSGSVVNVSQEDFFSLASITVADYASQPAVYIGCFECQYTAAGTSYYTVQSFTAGVDGAGLDFDNGSFLYPVASNGAATDTHWMANGGTAPVWTTKQMGYQIFRNGQVKIYLSQTAISTAGVGAVNARLTLPYAVVTQEVNCFGSGAPITAAGNINTLVNFQAAVSAPQIYLQFFVSNNVFQTNANITSTAFNDFPACVGYNAYTS